MLIKNAVPNLVHDQFGQKKPIPKGSGKTIEFRRLNPFAKTSTLFLGADAYGTTEIEGGGLQMITKPVGSAGTADLLKQRATSGWKATKIACILTQAFLVRVETASAY